MSYEVKHWHSGVVLRVVEGGETLPGGRAYLTGADLTGAHLRGADLTGADLTGADLRGAHLTGAYLTGADLTGAHLRGADLRGAHLRGALPVWTSHQYVSELLFRAAGDDVDRRSIAGLVRVSEDWCWQRWADIVQTHSQGAWAFGVLAACVREDDDAAPAELLAWMQAQGIERQPAPAAEAATTESEATP